MATWYYKQDGATIGPISQEDIIDRIDKGTVTFITVVRDADETSGKQKWSYAYETPLASYFKTGDMPSLPEAGMPPIPQEPEPEPTPEPEVAGPEKKPRIYPLIIAVFVVIFVIGLIIGAAFWYLTN